MADGVNRIWMIIKKDAKCIGAFHHCHCFRNGGNGIARVEMVQCSSYHFCIGFAGKGDTF